MKFSLTESKKVVKPSMERLFEGDKQDDANEMFKEVVKAFKYKFICWDLSHMHFVWSATPRTHDGDAKTDQKEVVKYTGSWTKWDTIYVQPNMEQALKFYGLEGKVSVEDLQKQAIAHELAHEIWKYQIDSSCKDKFLKKADDLTFDTPYLHHIDDDDKAEEIFCEYLAYRVTGIWIKCEQSNVQEGVQTSSAAPAATTEPDKKD